MNAASGVIEQHDKQTAQRGLREVIAILEAIKGGAPSQDVFYEMGRAIGVAKMTLFESGGKL